MVIKDQGYGNKDMLIKDQKNAFIIGGAQIYKEAIEKKLVDQLDITKVHQNFDADVFFPTIDMASWKEMSEETFLPDDKQKMAKFKEKIFWFGK